MSLLPIILNLPAASSAMYSKLYQGLPKQWPVLLAIGLLLLHWAMYALVIYCWFRLLLPCPMRLFLHPLIIKPPEIIPLHDVNWILYDNLGAHIMANIV